MKGRDLKEFFNSLSEEELDMDVFCFQEDNQNDDYLMVDNATVASCENGDKAIFLD